MRPAFLLSLAFCLFGCHALRPQLPSLILQARYQEGGGALGLDATHARRELVFGVGLRAITAPPPEPTFAASVPRVEPRPPAPCVSSTLCAWEARSRARELSRWEGRL